MTLLSQPHLKTNHFSLNMDILETNSKKRDEDGDIKTFDIKAPVDNHEVVAFVYISNALKHFHTGTL